MNGLQTAGIFLEACGLAVAFFGLRARFREFSGPGESEFDPIRRRARQAARGIWRRAVSTVRRLFRTPAPVVIVAGTAHLTASGSVNARGRVGYGPLPIARSNKPALGELDRRTRELLDRTSDLRERLDDEASRTDAALKAAAAELREHIQAIDERVRRLATGDVLLQYLGLGMIAVGLVFQAVGAWMLG